MGYKRLKKELKEFGLQEWSKGHSAGWDRGYEDAFESETLRTQLFHEGVQAERTRIIGLFKMLSDNELEHGTGTKAKFWKEASDIVKIADELEVYDEEGNSLDDDF